MACLGFRLLRYWGDQVHMLRVAVELVGSVVDAAITRSINGRLATD